MTPSPHDPPNPHSVPCGGELAEQKGQDPGWHWVAGLQRLGAGLGVGATLGEAQVVVGPRDLSSLFLLLPQL